MTKAEKAKNTLIEALKSARAEAEKHINDEDGGTCNFDTALLKRPDGITKAAFAEAIEAAGLRCSYDNSRTSAGQGFYHIYGYQSGQGERRTAMAETFAKWMKAYGYSADVYYQMD